MKKTILYLLRILCILTSFTAVSQVTANEPEDLITCDINNPGDGIEIFDLTTTIPEIIGDQTNVTVTFHLTSGSALGNGPGFPNPESYENVVNPQLVFVRVQGNGDSVITTFTIEVRLPFQPDTTSPEPLVIEDFDTDGFEVFDLTDIIPQFTNDPFVVDISYYETLQDAETASNPIANPENYTNITNPQTIFVRFQNAPQEECVTIVSYDIFANGEVIGVSETTLPAVRIYPNPASSAMILKNIDSDAKITLYDILGNTIAFFVNDQLNAYTIDVSAFSKGMYFIRIDQKQLIPFIKN